MRYLTLLLFLTPFVLLAQPKKGISILGGYELTDASSKVWNTELNFNSITKKWPRFSTEIGVNLSVLEYEGDINHAFDTTRGLPPSNGSNTYYPYGLDSVGYYVRRNNEHSQTISLRLQWGANYNILSTERLRFTAGVNLVMDFTADEKENGQEALVPIFPDISSPIIFRTYAIHKRFSGIDLRVQPHIDFSVKLFGRLWLTSRAAYYVMGRPQFNAGVSYRW